MQLKLISTKLASALQIKYKNDLQGSCTSIKWIETTLPHSTEHVRTLLEPICNCQTPFWGILGQFSWLWCQVQNLPKVVLSMSWMDWNNFESLNRTYLNPTRVDLQPPNSILRNTWSFFMTLVSSTKMTKKWSCPRVEWTETTLGHSTGHIWTLLEPICNCQTPFWGILGHFSWLWCQVQKWSKVVLSTSRMDWNNFGSVHRTYLNPTRANLQLPNSIMRNTLSFFMTLVSST